MMRYVRSLALPWLAGTGLLCTLTAAAASHEILLEDQYLRVAFDSRSGAITGLEDKPAQWIIERRPELGVSFRLFAPLPDRRYNPVLGRKQTADQVKKISDHEMRLRWKNLASENGGVLPITLTATVSLTNGILLFDAALKNDSPLTIETVDYPYLGDFNAPARDSSLSVCVRGNGKTRELRSDELYPHFRNEKGYWGVFCPLKTREARESPFCLIQAPAAGVYLAPAGPPVPYRLEYTFEQHPGVVSSVTALVPPQDTIANTPVHLEVRLCHFVFTPPHAAAALAPTLLRCYAGDSKAGVGLSQAPNGGEAR